MAIRDKCAEELLQRVAVLAGDDYTKNEVVQASLDRAACTFNADKTLTIQANDAYYQNNVTAYDADLIVFFVEIAEQAGGLADGTIGLRLTAFNGANLIDADDKNYIHFRPSGTTVHLMPLYLHITNSPTGIATVKLDWFYRSSSDSAENPTVTLKKLWFVKFNRAMSTP